MSQPARKWVSEEEYLRLEELAEERSEYYRGELFAMAGGTAEHSLISGNVLRELGDQLEAGPCRVFNSDLRVKIAETGLNTYPDVGVVCEEPSFDDARRTTLLNPIVLVEVLSDSTEAFDRGDKFGHYRRIPSLQQYVLVSSNQARIECFTRASDGAWVLSECSNPEGSLLLPAIGCVLSLPRVYAKVDFPPPGAGRRGPAWNSNGDKDLTDGMP
jgi:Uma2 family endonuclease